MARVEDGEGVALTADTGRLNPTAASLLGLLHTGDFSGYELVGVARLFIGDFWTLTRSQVYRELAALAGRGLVEAGRTGPRSRRPYRLTDAGRAAFAEWVALTPGADQVRIPLLLTIAFADHLPAERLAAVVAEHRQVHAARLARYREHKAALDGEGGVAAARLATLEFGLRHEQAVLDWFDVLPALLRRPPADGRTT